MKKRFKGILSIFLSMVMLISVTYGIDFTVNALDSSGMCGENVSYTFNSESGLLTIFGTGDMYDYDQYNRSPFFNNTQIKRVNIETGVTTIGAYVFGACRFLNYVSIPNSVYKIGEYALAECVALQNIFIPQSVTDIGYVAFGGCSNVTNISVDENNPVYDSRNNCNAIIKTSTNTLLFGCVNTIIPNDITCIADYAFYAVFGSNYKYDFIIPESVTQIGDYAFYYCRRLEKLTIPKSVTHIGSNLAYSETIIRCYFESYAYYYAMNYGYQVDSIDEPTPIAISVFNLPYKLVYPRYSKIDKSGLSIKIEYENGSSRVIYNGFECSSGDMSTAGTKTITVSYKGYTDTFDVIVDASLFPGEYEINDDDTVTITGYYGKDSEFAIPSIINGKAVTRIGKYAFDSSEGLQKIIIPEGVTTIDDYAFQNCSDLVDVVLPDSLLSIGISAFRDCSNILEITIPDSIKYIDEETFRGCYNLSNIILPDSIISIGDGVFDGCENLTQINIPKNVVSIGTDVLRNCKNLVKITVDEENANYDSRNDCNAIVESSTNILISGCQNTKIPNNVVGIGDGAFSYCKFKSFVIPNSVVSIGERAFSSCNELSEIVIPNSVKSIGEYAFEWCGGLVEIVIPSSVVSIGDYAFWVCYSLEKIIIPESVTYIGENAFQSCYNNLTIYGYEDSYIESYAHDNNIPFAIIETSEIVSISINTLPNKTVYSKYRDFNTDGLSILVTYADGQTSIRNAGFSCSDVDMNTVGTKTVIVDYKGFTTTFDIIVDDSVFDCDYTINDDNKTITIENYRGNSNKSNVIIPSEFEGYTVTGIGNSAFYGRDNIKEIFIPNTVKSIGRMAFSRCYNLESIIIPDSVSYIGESAFSGCSGLTEIIVDENNPYYDSRNNCNAIIDSVSNTLIRGCCNTVIPNDIKVIGYEAFYECYDLTDIVIPNGVTRIEESAFEYCGLTSLNIPSSVTNIGTDAFGACSNLSEIVVDENNLYYDSRNDCNAIIISSNNELILGCKNTVIPDSVKNIGSYAFALCNDLTEIHIPDGVISIGDYAFYQGGLKKVTLPNSLEYIGSHAFSWCRELTEINIPNSVKSIGDFAFSLCQSLTSITLPDGLEIISAGAFEDCENLTEINIPDSVKSIGNRAFSWCRSLTSITIPNGVKNIYKDAFMICDSLTKIVIPESVSYIGEDAFYECYGLTIYGYEGSYAQQYAYENSIPFESIETAKAISISIKSYPKTIYSLYGIISVDGLVLTIHYDDGTTRDINYGFEVSDVDTSTEGVKRVTVSYKGLSTSYYITVDADIIEYPESEHPYLNESNLQWLIRRQNAKNITITFSDYTETESGFDYISIYDVNNKLIGKYSGNDLSGKTITVDGPLIKIVLTSDGSVTEYGFKVTNIAFENEINEDFTIRVENNDLIFGNNTSNKEEVLTAEEILELWTPDLINKPASECPYLDVVQDGIINAKDYAMLLSLID